MSSTCELLKRLSERGLGKYVEYEKYCILYLNRPVKVTYDISVSKRVLYDFVNDAKLQDVEDVKMGATVYAMHSVNNVANIIGKYVSGRDEKITVYRVTGYVIDRIVGDSRSNNIVLAT